MLHQLFRLPYKLHNEVHGSGEKTIIFLHGIASSSANWINVLKLLEDDFTCITIDLLGFGDSPKPAWPDYTIEDHVKSLRYTIKKLGIKEPYILVGHSLGSLLACRYASLHPKEIARLFMLSPPIYLSDKQTKSKIAKTFTKGYFAIYKFLRTNQNFTLKNASLVAKLLPSRMLDLTDQTWIPFIRTLEHCIEQQTVISDIAEVRCQVEVLYGKLDQVIVQKNINILKAMHSVNVHELKTSDHIIRGNYAKILASLLNNNLPAATATATAATARKASTSRKTR